MFGEMLEGQFITNKEIAEMFDKSFEQEGNNDLVVISKIPIFSFCEHHVALMYNMEVAVGYIPRGRVIGLSKVAWVAEMVGKRLQLQEKIGHDINEIIRDITGSKDVIVVVKGEHSCMTARGIKKPGSVTRTSAIFGAFKTNDSLRQEFYNLI
jgi:GTP cyclohydrolase I